MRAAIRSCVRTVSLPIKLAASPGAQDHCVPMAPPSLETATTATERNLPARAKASCCCSTSMIDAISSSGAASETTFGNVRTLSLCAPIWLLITQPRIRAIARWTGPATLPSDSFRPTLRQLDRNVVWQPPFAASCGHSVTGGPMSGEVEAVAPTGQAARSAGQESECMASAPRRTPQGTPQVAPAQAVELIQVRRWRSGRCPVNGRR